MLQILPFVSKAVYRLIAPYNIANNVPKMISAKNIEVSKQASKIGCNWHSLMCTNAAESGHLEILKWAR